MRVKNTFFPEHLQQEIDSPAFGTPYGEETAFVEYNAVKAIETMLEYLENGTNVQKAVAMRFFGEAQSVIDGIKQEEKCNYSNIELPF